MEQKKVNKEVENKWLEEFKRKLLDELREKLSRAQKIELTTGIRYVYVSGTQDACIVKLRMNWKSVVTWIFVSLLIIILIAIGVVLSPFIVAEVIYDAVKRELSDKVVDCVSIPEIGEE